MHFPDAPYTPCMSTTLHKTTLKEKGTKQEDGDNAVEAITTRFTLK